MIVNNRLIKKDVTKTFRETTPYCSLWNAPFRNEDDNTLKNVRVIHSNCVVFDTEIVPLISIQKISKAYPYERVRYAFKTQNDQKYHEITLVNGLLQNTNLKRSRYLDANEELRKRGLLK